MANLIDRDKLMQEVYYRYNLAYGGESYNPYDFYQLVQSFPTVEEAPQPQTTDITLRDILKLAPSIIVKIYMNKEGDCRFVGSVYRYEKNGCVYKDEILDAKVDHISTIMDDEISVFLTEV